MGSTRTLVPNDSRTWSFLSSALAWLVHGKGHDGVDSIRQVRAKHADARVAGLTCELAMSSLGMRRKDLALFCGAKTVPQSFWMQAFGVGQAARHEIGLSPQVGPDD